MKIVVKSTRLNLDTLKIDRCFVYHCFLACFVLVKSVFFLVFSFYYMQSKNVIM